MKNPGDKNPETRKKSRFPDSQKIMKRSYVRYLKGQVSPPVIRFYSDSVGVV